MRRLALFGLSLLALAPSLVDAGRREDGEARRRRAFLGERKCKPIFVRWPRVKLNVPARLNGPFSLARCRDACGRNENPHNRNVEQTCAAFNHRIGPSDYSNECHIFEEPSVRRTDGLIEGLINGSFRFNNNILISS